MIPVLNELTLSTGYVLAGLLLCNAEPPTITVVSNKSPVEISNTETMDQLSQKRAQSSAAIYSKDFPLVNGLTGSKFTFSSEIEFEKNIYPLVKHGCITAKNIRINIDYKAKIYVARKIKPDTCRFNVTKNHELRHVQEDLTTIKEYIPYMKDMIKLKTENLYSEGPISEDALTGAEKKISKNINTVVEEVKKSFESALSVRQQKIDTREEYYNLSKACRYEKFYKN